MSYAIRPRTAITLDAFRGDVATVRTGALARTDTRIGIGVQQEVRHNLLFNAGLSWRQTDYRGTSDQTQRIWGGNVEAEYLLNSHLSIAAMGWYRSEEHTSELQSLMRISYAVFCLKNKNITRT